ncbi:MAG: TonB-dependent receptor [Acidobacteriota bacterium]|nr:TonB-dependent receptor [Acidobacteriota bacterium]
MKCSSLFRGLALLCVVGVAIFSFAQSEAGRIAGTVTDTSGAVVSGATVSVTNLGTDRVVTVTTGGAGEFSIPTLPPANYMVQVKAPNFKTVTQDVTLQVGQVLPLNFSLTAGAVTENVEVTSAAPLVSSDSSDLGTVIQGKQIVDLMLDGRNFTQLALLTPGVTRGSNNTGDANGTSGNAETYRYNTSGGAALSVNGLRPQANNFLLDGFDNNESLVNTIIFFSAPDAIQEFRVATNVAPAEFGRAGGGVINTAIKSGTNQIHGVLWEFLRNSALDATPWTPQQNAKKFPFKQNQFGAAAGGPIIKNKLFVFGDYQGFRASAPASTDYATVPTDLMRSSGYTNFSELLSEGIQIKNPLTGLPFPGNIITIPLNPAAVNYLNAYPVPNCNNSTNSSCHSLTQNYTTTRQRIQTINDFDVRADWNIGAKDTAFFRYSYGNDNLTTTSRLPDLPAGFGSGTNPTKPWSAVGEETHLFTPNLINEFRFGFIRTTFGYQPPFGNVPLSANLGIVNANVNGLGQPDPALGGGALIGGYNNQLEYTGDYGPYVVPQDTWQEADNLSWVKGKHTMKFGANILRRQVDFFRPLTGKGYFFLFGNGQTPSITGYEVTDLLIGFTNQYQIGPVLGNSQTRNWETGFYGQDDWKVTRRLTLNLGLRWDLITWPVEKNNNQSNFDIYTGQILLAGQDGNSRSFIPVSYHNFAPRIGFAFDPTGSGQSKFSGGYGIFYFVDRGGISNQLAQNPPFSGQESFNYVNGYRITFTGQAPLGTYDPNTGQCLTSCNPVGAVTPLPLKGPIMVNLNNPVNVAISVATLPSNKTPSVQEWNFQYERQLGSNVSMSLAYVGTKGTHLVTYYNYNRQYYNSPQNTVNFPQLSAINTQATIGNSSYNALQATLNRRFTNGLQFGASYTWSHAIDDSPGAFDNPTGSSVDYRDLKAERSNSDLDMRQRFVMSGIYDLPFGRGRKWGSDWNGFTNSVLGGWQTNLIFTAASGTPFDLSYTGGNPTVRPNLVGDPMAGITTPYEYFNPAAFAPVPMNAAGVILQAGTTPRNFLVGPGTMDIDFATFKNFNITERYVLQFRAEFFNITNTPQFASPDASLTDGNFGKITTGRLASERQIQFALKFSF